MVFTGFRDANFDQKQLISQVEALGGKVNLGVEFPDQVFNSDISLS